MLKFKCTKEDKRINITYLMEFALELNVIKDDLVNYLHNYLTRKSSKSIKLVSYYILL